ncbi:hypothetical protein [Marinobacterium arenosum]|uniref:hypothetical protein n=1 Tax=Marinobacterium arenosum TaxID=2862496 RepID=UPI001C97185C|nr:hypothetical protein [Marinobacterium arenosum]MBY4675223.1 hypothetical protein [Marinobacterium arenosum]
MNIKSCLLLSMALLLPGTALAEKPANVGPAKHQVGQSADKAKKVKAAKADDNKGLEKQRAKKAEQVQKELDKGSEQGQASRENRKKWWKFWGD